MGIFGNNSISGATDPGADTVSQIVGSAYALLENGTVTKMTMYFPGGLTQPTRGVIYPAPPNGTAPLGATVEVPNGAAGWIDFQFSGPGVSLLAGNYMLGAWFGGSGDHLFDNSSIGTGSFMNTGATYSQSGTAPNPFADNAPYTAAWCIYATYRVGQDLDALMPMSVSLRM